MLSWFWRRWPGLMTALAVLSSAPGERRDRSGDQVVASAGVPEPPAAEEARCPDDT